MSNCDISIIERVCSTKNVGGLKKKIWIIPVEQTSSIPKQYCSLSNTDNVVLLPGFTSVYFDIDRHSGNFLEKQIQGNKAGDYFEQQLTFFISKDRIEVAQQIQNLKDRRVHIVYVDCNGVKKLVFNMKIKADLNTRQKKPDANGYSWVCTSKSIKKAPFWEGNII